MNSIQYEVLKVVIEAQKFKPVFEKQGEELKQYVLKNFRNENGSAPYKKVGERLKISRRMVNEKPCYKVISRKKVSDKKVLYIHGGGYMMEASAMQWDFIEELTNETGAQVYFPEYPLVPESNCTQALNMVLEVYKHILRHSEPENIIIMGDSAGGGISLSLAMMIRDLGLPQPADVIMICPSVEIGDPELIDKELIDYLERKDPIVSLKCGHTISEWWRGELEYTDYHVNPVYGDLTNLPKLTMFSGTFEVLNVYARKLMKNAKKQGVSIEYHEKEGMIHDWVIFKIPESKDARKRVFDIIKDTNNPCKMEISC